MEQVIRRKKTKSVRIGAITIGAGHPIAIQSMIKVPTKRIGDVVKQAQRLQKAGCEIIRVAVKDTEDAASLRVLRKKIAMPLVADIHFHYQFALQAIDAGLDKIRLNPGNVYQKDQVRQIARRARAAKVPIRVGVNSGSIHPRYERIKSGSQQLVRQAQDYIAQLEDFGVRDLVVSLKASHVLDTIDAYRRMSRVCRYPLHVGVTATGLLHDGIIKSSLGIGVLLSEGVGDTIRVSLLADPEEEIVVAQQILASLGIRRFGPEYICCPTCGRCEVDLRMQAQQVAKELQGLKGRYRARSVAVMGCMVNGPGEAKHADIGVAFGRSKGIVFEKGRIVETVPVQQCVKRLLKRMNGHMRQRSHN